MQRFIYLMCLVIYGSLVNLRKLDTIVNQEFQIDKRRKNTWDILIKF